MKMAESSPKRLENTVRKGVIDCYVQVSPFPTMFSKDLYCRLVKQGLVWERVKFGNTEQTAFADDHTTLAKLMVSVLDREDNIVGKGENAIY